MGEERREMDTQGGGVKRKDPEADPEEKRTPVRSPKQKKMGSPPGPTLKPRHKQKQVSHTRGAFGESGNG